MSEIDFGPILVEAVIPLLSALLLALGGWAIRWIGTRFKLAADAEIRGYLETALERGVAYGAAKAAEMAAGRARLQVRAAAVAEGAQYVIDAVPDALRHFGVTPARLEAMIEARLPADSPAAPAQDG